MSTRIVIIGGVAGGMSAATRARRMNEDASIIVFERGGFISFANCGLPYYIAGKIKAEKDLLITNVDMVRRRFNIDARVNHDVVRIDRSNHQVEVVDLVEGRRFTVGYDKLILATGANPIIPPIDNVDCENVFLLRSMEDTRRITNWLELHRPKSAVVVGGGFIGLEMAESLHARGIHVTIVEKAAHILPPIDPEMASDVTGELIRNGVRVISGSGLKSLDAGEGKVTGVETETGERVETELVLLSIGVRPNTSLAVDAGLKIGPSAAVAVDPLQRTSDPDIYAVGDVSELVHGVTHASVRIPLAGLANRQGRLAGEHAATGSASPAGKGLGTAIVQVFDLAVGTTGLSESAASNAGFDVDVAYVMGKHHAGYYPGAAPMNVKLIYDAASGRVLGAQIVGSEGVDKRIDVVATTIHFGGTIDDLATLDLAYAPQFGSAKDVVHIVAMVAQNQRRHLMSGVRYADLTDEFLLDVRTPAENAKGTLPHAVNIPLDELRQRLPELKPDQSIVAFCQVGLRGYVAQRILQQHGFMKVKNLKGGFTLAVRSGAEVRK